MQLQHYPTLQFSLLLLTEGSSQTHMELRLKDKYRNELRLRDRKTVRVARHLVPSVLPETITSYFLTDLLVFLVTAVSWSFLPSYYHILIDIFKYLFSLDSQFL